MIFLICGYVTLYFFSSSVYSKVEMSEQPEHVNSGSFYSFLTLMPFCECNKKILLEQKYLIKSRIFLPICLPQGKFFEVI